VSDGRSREAMKIVKAFFLCIPSILLTCAPCADWRISRTVSSGAVRSAVDAFVNPRCIVAIDVTDLIFIGQIATP